MRGLKISGRALDIWKRVFSPCTWSRARSLPCLAAHNPDYFSLIVRTSQESISKLLRCMRDSVQTLFGVSPVVTCASSDRSHPIRNGVKSVFPEVRNVLCWVHILRDVRGPDIHSLVNG